MFTQKISVPKLAVAASLIAGSFLTVAFSYGQGSSNRVYYSQFPNTDTAGKYGKTDPTSSCGAPAIQDIGGVIDLSTLSTFAKIYQLNGTQRYNCAPGDQYKITVDLNLRGDSSYLGAGNQAGFLVSIPDGFNNDSLGYYLKVSTYLRDSSNPNNVTPQEYAVGGGSSGLQLQFVNQAPGVVVYFNTTKPFNLLELDVDPAIITPGTNFKFGIYYGTGGQILGTYPAIIANFKTSVLGKDVNVSWQSLTETNVKNYRVERNNGSGTYSVVATIPAKGNSTTALSYAFTDKVGVDGKYLYRLVTVNNDGTTKTTSPLAAVISGQGSLLLYPTIVKAGQNVTVKTTETGLVSVYMFDATGRLVKQQRTTSNGQFSIPTSGLSNGVYNVKVVSASGAVLQSKIVVN